MGFQGIYLKGYVATVVATNEHLALEVQYIDGGQHDGGVCGRERPHSTLRTPAPKIFWSAKGYQAEAIT